MKIDIEQAEQQIRQAEIALQAAKRNLEQAKAETRTIENGDIFKNTKSGSIWMITEDGCVSLKDCVGRNFDTDKNSSCWNGFTFIGNIKDLIN